MTDSYAFTTLEENQDPDRHTYSLAGILNSTFWRKLEMFEEFQLEFREEFEIIDEN